MKRNSNEKESTKPCDILFMSDFFEFSREFRDVYIKQREHTTTPLLIFILDNRSSYGMSRFEIHQIKNLSTILRNKIIIIIIIIDTTYIIYILYIIVVMMVIKMEKFLILRRIVLLFCIYISNNFFRI